MLTLNPLESFGNSLHRGHVASLLVVNLEFFCRSFMEAGEKITCMVACSNGSALNLKMFSQPSASQWESQDVLLCIENFIVKLLYNKDLCH